MHFIPIAETDIGKRRINQDSALVKHAVCERGEVLMAIVCDGMGGLKDGELASASVIKAFSRWFDNELPVELLNPDMEVIGREWELLLKDMNARIGRYPKDPRAKLGTTFSGILFIGDQYLLGHVGDSRIYFMGRQMIQMTEDQTYVQQQINLGRMTPEQAKTDPMRNYLLQCIGASASVTPQIASGKAQPGSYLLCSDGFRHEITSREIYDGTGPKKLTDKDVMHTNLVRLIKTAQERGETDNITAVLIKAE